MKSTDRLMLWVYDRLAGLVRWLPARLKNQFGAEIEEVFAARLDDAAERGWRALIAVLLRELIHLPPIHVRELWFRQLRLGIAMTEQRLVDQIMVREARPSWRSAAAWALPYLLFGTALTILELTPAWAPGVGFPPPFSTGVVALLVALALTLVVLAFTLTKTVSAGWFGSLGLTLACAWYLSDLSSWGKPVGSWLWCSFPVAAAAAVLRARSVRVLWAPFQAAWRDWTHLSFLVYGGLAFLLLTVQLDSVKGMAAIPVLMGHSLIFALGAALALRVVTPLRRVLALDGALALIVAVPLFIEVLTRPDLSFDAWRGFGLVILLAFWLGSLFVPGLLGLLRMGLRRRTGAEGP
jgi:hypothetical protein